MKASVVVEKEKEDKDARKGCLTTRKDVKGSAASVIATPKEDAACGERIATREEERDGKASGAEEAQKGREKDVNVGLPKEGQRAGADVPAPDDSSNVPAAGQKDVDAVPLKEGKRSKAAVPASVDSSNVSIAASKEGSVEVPTAAANSKKRAPRARVAAPKKEVVPTKVTSKKAPRAAGRQKAQATELSDLCQALMDLPHDVIYTVRSHPFLLFVYPHERPIHQVLGHLPPLHLVALRGANRVLKGLLDSPSPWKAARKMTYETPDPPKGVSEWRWATILWGNKCDVRVLLCCHE